MSEKLTNLKVGEYDFFDDTWEVRLNKTDWFECKNHYQALMLSKLIKIEKMLNKLTKGAK